jgi:hypothetical protein
MLADLAVLILLVKRAPRLTAGTGQTRRIDDVRGCFTFNRSEIVRRREPEFPPPRTSG